MGRTFVFQDTFTPTPPEQLVPFPDGVVSDFGPQDKLVRAAGGLVDNEPPLFGHTYAYRLTRQQLEDLLTGAWADGVRDGASNRG